jgi:methylenetetrahydrofolate reductase (NADPH)
VPGVHAPTELIERIAKAANQQDEGKQVCIELIGALRQIEGVAGVHVMGHRNEDVLAQIIVESAAASQPKR